MRISDWSSDVCSSDLVWNEAGTSLAARVLQRMPLEDMSRIALQAAQWLEATFDILPQPARLALFPRLWDASQIAADPAAEWELDMTLINDGAGPGHGPYKIGRTQCGERGWQYVEHWVGGGYRIKNKIQT